MTATITRAMRTARASAPLSIEVTLAGRAAVAHMEHFTMTDDGRLVPLPDEPAPIEVTAKGRMHLYERGRIRSPFLPADDTPPTVEQLRARGKKPDEAAAHGPRNIGMEDEPGEERARSEAWFSGVLHRVGELLQSGQVTDSDQ